MELQVESEVNQYVPFSMDEVSLDYCVVGPSPTAPDELEVMVAASRKDKVELQALRDASRKDKAELASLSSQAKLRAAAKDDLAKSSAKVDACVDMLSRAEKVLQTCCELHASKNDASPLAAALKDTANRMATFLKTVEPKSF